jgi:hypothetical protein
LREGSRVPPAAVPTPPHPDDPPGWWEQRWLLITLVLAAAVPLLWPETPPLTDLPGHIGRYRIQLGIDQSASLARYYGFEWALIGNLGVDLLIEPLARLIGLEPAVKLIVTAIPMMTAAGFLLVARELNGRVPPTAFFALPLAYSFPFHFGFVNFALSMALALLAFRFGFGSAGPSASAFAPLCSCRSPSRSGCVIPSDGDCSACLLMQWRSPTSATGAAPAGSPPSSRAGCTAFRWPCHSC